MSDQSLNENDVKLLVNMVIHDLEKPLKVIARVLERIQNETFDIHNPQHAKIVSSSLCSVKRSESMLNDLNDVLLMRSLPVHKKPFDLNELIENIGNQFQIICKEEHIRFFYHSAETYTLNSDPELIQRIIENYLQNALNHTVAGGEIRLELSANDAGDLLIQVKNHGGAIPAQYLDQIFQPGIQLNLRSQRKFKGHGLGLAFCRLAAGALGATVAAENLQGNSGVSFSLKLNSSDIINNIPSDNEFVTLYHMNANKRSAHS
ncbi:HAMP domain-containing histidine kinase [candidate division KSB1 bacterium]|nr:HAMP domain-containing histidine kinase [candidate division KSB1 bacterium]